MNRLRQLLSTAAAQAWLVCLVVFALVFATQGNRVTLTNDEGIILDAAERIVRGQRPYVDFFGYMSPGSYWLQAWVFGLFGRSLWSARLVVITDFAAIAALLFWLTARFANRAAGLAATALFVIFQASQPELLTAQHRWDSAALSLGSVVLSVQGQRRWCSMLAGALVVAAAFCTPSIGMVAVVTVLWLFSRKAVRPLVDYVAGASLATLAALAALAITGGLQPMLQQMLWLKQNYSGVNVMSYGAIIGGYEALFRDAAGLELALRAGLVLCIALPAVLPVLLLPGWGGYLWRNPSFQNRSAILYLLGCMIVLVASAFPRADVMHLAFVCGISYALVAILFVAALPRRAAALAGVFFAVWAAMFLLNYTLEFGRGHQLSSPVGELRAPPPLDSDLHRLLASIGKGDSLYVHPYMPVLYFLTQGSGATRYSFLAPGMMTGREEAAALEELERKSPRWVLYLPLTAQEFLRVFPTANPDASRFERIESWILAHYVAPAQPVRVGGYQLLERGP